MRSSTSQAGIQRMVTGNRCEEQRCGEIALWLVTYNGKTSHWCAKHTRMFMRNRDVRGKKGVPDIER